MKMKLGAMLIVAAVGLYACKKEGAVAENSKAIVVEKADKKMDVNPDSISIGGEDKPKPTRP